MIFKFSDDDDDDEDEDLLMMGYTKFNSSYGPF